MTQPGLFDEAGPQFPGASAASAISVGTLTRAAKDVLEAAFTPVWVRGEIADFKRHRNGHWYFCMRDGDSVLRCVVWSRDQRGIPASPDNGMQLAALGQLSVYAARGEMQFTVRRMEAEGEGLWRKALELTKQRLEADGLLAPERKRPIPRYPRCVAVVTSPDGAALHDIISVLRRRARGVSLVVVPAAVQGESAPREIVAAIQRVARWGKADTLIVGRGGGSRDDLRAFDDEKVARAVAASPVPTISAVGHEVDISICDLVADWRAPTPSAAAELAVRAYDEAAAEVRALDRRVRGALKSRLDSGRRQLRQEGRALAALGRRHAERRRARMEQLAGRLEALSPLSTMARGFAIARGADGRTLGSARQFEAGSPFELLLRDGVVSAVAETVSVTRLGERETR
jgi:exodeoxyribonuclease VII large subunit